MAKGPRAYRDIAEAAAEVGVEAHVLRFWERELRFIKPLKRAGGRRFYRPRDLDLLREVRRLRQDGRSLAEIRRLSAEHRLARGSQLEDRGAAPKDWSTAWRRSYSALEAAKRRLDSLLAQS